MEINKILGIVLMFVLVLPLILALSEESIQAEQLINQAEKDISEMSLENIPTTRVNESYQEAIQIYSGQLFLEEMGRRAEYKTVIEFTSEINLIRKNSLKANDELEVFKEVFNSAKEEINLSEMYEDYDNVLLSFEEERFEDTLILINEGYEKLSEVQASQTTLKLFYLTTSKTIKNFFINNWLKLVIVAIVILFAFLIFKTTISKLKIRIKLNYIVLRKHTLNKLIKDMQFNYFRNRKMSKTEYDIKLKKFTEMLRDIDRQTMILKEKIFRLKKNKSLLKLKNTSLGKGVAKGKVKKSVKKVDKKKVRKVVKKKVIKTKHSKKN